MTTENDPGLGHHDGDEDRPEHEWFTEGNLASLVKRIILRASISAIREEDFEHRGRRGRFLIIPITWEEDD